jgi:hypothetical protein
MRTQDRVHGTREAAARQHINDPHPPEVRRRRGRPKGSTGISRRHPDSLLAAEIAKSPLAYAALLTGMVLEGAEAQEWYLTRVIPACIEQFEPVTVNDPACGSGVLLLAYASTLPRWMVELGLVQFSGQDIDQLCVRMARINFALYGVNGYNIRLAAALIGTDPTSVASGQVEG